MKFLTICLAICMSIVLTSAQYFGNFGQYGGINHDFGFNSLQGDYGSFGGSLGNVRDARQDRGPVTFPIANDPNAPVETSGVIVGASGFGFVPPQKSSLHRFRGFRFF